MTRKCVQTRTPCALGASRSVGPPKQHRALSPTRLPRVPPETMLGPKALSYPRDGAPNIVKDGTPHQALSSACRSRRSPDTRGGLSPACFPSAPCRSLCDRRGLPTRDCSPRLAPWAGVPFLTFLGTDLHRPSKPGGPQECQGWQPRGARRGVTAPSTRGAPRPPHTEQTRRGLRALTLIGYWAGPWIVN
jgi:hypothetical protein